ncbi:uncharacterized protein [Panulirus ornatus]|uniref:uncharacterized protein isoform X2 n=1 Tax=Panulirus ornatus TaxID=150431 RepID=UPI003A8890BF
MKRLLWFASVFALLYGSCILITIIGTPQLGRLMFSIFERHAAHCDQRCPIPPLTSISQYNDYLNTAQTHCHNWAQMGGWLSAPGDGMKYVCLDERFNIRPGNCVVLSFGVNNEWSFEDDMDKFGCKSFPVDRYENIIERLGLSGHVIDYVKLDVELSELDFLQDIVNNSPHLLHNIKQLAIEIHHDLVKGKLDPTSTLQIFWPYFHRLHCHGFNIILSRFAGFWREIVWARDDKL